MAAEAGVEITCVVDKGAKVGEGAVWDGRDQRLWWVDIPEGEIYGFDPSTGENEVLDFGEPVGCLAVREKGGLVVAAKSGFYFYAPETGHRSPISDPEADKPDNRFNDGGTDRQGRFWAGTMKDGGDPAPEGSFYRLDHDLSVHPQFDGIYTTNGLAFSPDGRTMYFSDSNKEVRTIWACDYDPDDGVPTNRRVFFDTREVDGRPDGGTVDADGCYWMAGVSGWQLVRLTPAGKVDRIIEMPVERPSKPMFGGPNLDTLFVTSLSVGLISSFSQPCAGGLFAVEGLGVQGLPEARFPA